MNHKNQRRLVVLISFETKSVQNITTYETYNMFQELLI